MVACVDQANLAVEASFLEVVMESNFGVIMELYHIKENKYRQNTYLYGFVKYQEGYLPVTWYKPKE